MKAQEIKIKAIRVARLDLQEAFRQSELSRKGSGHMEPGQSYLLSVASDRKQSPPFAEGGDWMGGGEYIVETRARKGEKKLCWKIVHILGPG